MERAIEITALLFAVVPVFRLAMQEPIRVELRERRVLRMAAVAALALGIAATGVALAREDHSLRILTGLALALAFWAWLRARPGYGSRRGLPPGSLGLTSSLESVRDPQFYSRQASRWGDVFKMSQFHRPTVCITDLALGLEFFEAQQELLRQPAAPFPQTIPGGYIELMDGAVHARYRGILAPALNGAALRDSRPLVTNAIRTGLTAMADRGEAAEGVSPDPALDGISFAALVGVFYGVTSDDGRFDSLRAVYEALGAGGEIATGASRSPTNSLERVCDAVRDAAAHAAQTGPSHTSLRTSVVSALSAQDPDWVRDTTLVANVAFMLQVGRNNCAGFLRWLLKLNADNPHWLALLRELEETNPTGGSAESRQADDLATRIVNETLRLSQSEYVYRITTRACQLKQFRIPQGWLVRLCLRECHRRADLFPDPEHFDPDRFLAKSQPKHVYAPFGDGAHSCFGAALTMMVARTFVRELARGFDIQITQDGPIERGNRHWNHWRASRQLRVRIQQRLDSSRAVSA